MNIFQHRLATSRHKLKAFPGRLCFSIQMSQDVSGLGNSRCLFSRCDPCDSCPSEV